MATDITTDWVGTAGVDGEIRIARREALSWLVRKDDGWKRKRIAVRGIRTVLEGTVDGVRWVEVAYVAGEEG